MRKELNGLADSVLDIIPMERVAICIATKNIHCDLGQFIGTKNNWSVFGTKNLGFGRILPICGKVNSKPIADISGSNRCSDAEKTILINKVLSNPMVLTLLDVVNSFPPHRGTLFGRATVWLNRVA